MIKLIEAHHLGDFRITLRFSDGTEGIFDGNEFLKRNGPLLDALRNESYFQQAFIDAGALCWPNGLELSPTRLHQTCKALDPA
ncbi:MAG: DUF2442 domain-containing protein [Sulfuritalea sp.]|jgi:hypothetical protein|nr:DUF2442 domain-containing protein [Sulfuritalea sp.]